MRFKTTSGELSDIVVSLSGTSAVSADSDLTISSLLFEPLSDDGSEFRVWAANGSQQQIRNMAFSDTESPSSFLLSAQRIVKICSKLPRADALVFNVNEERCLISSEHSEYNLPSNTEVDLFPKMEDDDAESSVKVAEKHLNFIFNQIVVSMGRNDPRYYLNGVFLSVKKGVIIGVATNGHRLAKCEMNIEDKDVEFQTILPGKFVEDVCKLLEFSDSLAEIRYHERNVNLVTDRFNLATNTIEGKYPEWEKVIPKEFEWQLEIGKEDLLNGVQRAMVVADKPESPVAISNKDDYIEVFVKNPHTNEEGRAKIKGKSEGGGFQIGVNGGYLIDAVNIIDADDVVLEMKDSESAVKLYGKDTQQSLFLIMPIKL